jgi:hypothetical protein
MITVKQLQFILDTTNEYNNKFIDVMSYGSLIIFKIAPDVKIRLDLTDYTVTLSKERVITNE